MKEMTRDWLLSAESDLLIIEKISEEGSLGVPGLLFDNNFLRKLLIFSS